MKTSHIQSRLGTTQIWVDGLRAPLQLPENFLIYCRSDRQWIGGSCDGRYYLYLEKLGPTSEELPTVLAIPEIDLFFCSTGPVEAITTAVQLAPVSGSLASQWVTGCLAQVRLHDQGDFLALVAASRSAQPVDARTQALAVIEQLLL